MNKRISSKEFLARNKKEILKTLEEKQQARIQEKIEKSPVIKLGNVKPEGIVLEMKARDIK